MRTCSPATGMSGGVNVSGGALFAICSSAFKSIVSCALAARRCIFSFRSFTSAAVMRPRWRLSSEQSGICGRKPQARELVLIAVLVALNVAGRAAFFMLPEFKPVVAMTILAGVAFGGETGFLVGAMTMLVSNMLFSQGPWTPWQMFAMGIIGWLAGVLYRKGVLRRGRLSLCIFGVIASTIIYGGIMNPASALMWSNTINWKIILSYYVTGLPVDLVRAIATFFFLWLIAEPMLEKLDRVKVKYGLAE